jgi:hypothetical protein
MPRRRAVPRIGSLILNDIAAAYEQSAKLTEAARESIGKAG